MSQLYQPSTKLVPNFETGDEIVPYEPFISQVFTADDRSYRTCTLNSQDAEPVSQAIYPTSILRSTDTEPQTDVKWTFPKA